MANDFVTVLGAKEFKAALRAMPTDIKKDIAKTLNESGRELRGALKAAAPKRTGFLKRSIRLSKRATTRKMRAIVSMWFYGRFLDMGTKTISATNWASRVIDSFKPKHVERMRAAVESGVKKMAARNGR